jgi:signal transduction histidine kinase
VTEALTRAATVTPGTRVVSYFSTGGRDLVGQVLLTGEPAVTSDFNDAIYGPFPWLVVGVLVLIFAALMRAFRSWLVPLMAVLMSGLSLLASYGLLHRVLQRGIGAAWLGVDQDVRGIAPWVPVLLSAFLFGISMDYQVFLVERMRELRDGGTANRGAVRGGLRGTGRVIVCAPRWSVPRPDPPAPARAPGGAGAPRRRRRPRALPRRGVDSVHPGDYFWPIWVALALAIPLGVHAWIVLRDGDDRREMAERIDVLTASRAGAVDQQAAGLRRIERDLHDGAQARLVALAMDLGMARERLASDPEARDLVAGAHEQAKQALAELRDLARGIHPVVLTDRGLPATLAGHSRIPVELEVETGERSAAAVKAAARFVAAEALTNANKHSGAERVRVHVARRGGVMEVRVSDDGAGGADPGGEGLRGLRHRVEALDGTMSVTSATGAGTVLSVELPCGS